MNFTPLTKKQIQASNILAPGEYDFVVEKASNFTTPKGNEAIKLKLRIPTSDGTAYPLETWLVNLPRFAFLLRSFCGTTGMLNRYNDGVLNPNHCDGKTGKVLIGIEAGANIVEDFVFEETFRVKTVEP